MNTKRWIKFAEIMDINRVASRFIFIVLIAFVIWYTHYVTQWYFTNFKELGENAAMMYGASGFLGFTIPALFKFATDYALKYLDGGTDWIKRHQYLNSSNMTRR